MDAATIHQHLQASLSKITGTDVVLTETLTPDDLEHWDSMMPVELELALEKKLHVKFTAAEIAGLQKGKEPFMQFARLLEARLVTPAPVRVSFDADFPVVPLQPAGNLTPFFCVHGAGGIVIPFYELVRPMGEARPFYGLQDTLSDVTDHSGSVEALAARYVEAIRRVQPQGPYLIGGLCFGGLVAFEIARQLTAAGQTVANLVMISTPRGDDRFDKFRWHEKITKGTQLLWQIWSDTLFHLNEPFYLALASRRLQRKQAGQKISAFEEKLCGFFQRHSTLGMIVPPDSKVLLNRQFNVQKHGMLKLAKYHVELHRRYVGAPYAGRVTFIKAEHTIVSTGGYTDDVQGWGPLFTGPVNVHVVHGCHHMNITRAPAVTELARILQTALAA